MIHKLVLTIFLCFASALGAWAQDDNSQIESLPLHVSPSSGKKPVLFYFTGDGGWNDFSQKLVAELSANGYGVIALDTRKYFWEAKTPDGFARQMQAVWQYYQKKWNISEFAIVGYSFGADVAAFLPGRMNESIGKLLKSIVLLSPGLSTDFEVKLSNMVGFNSHGKYQVDAEVQKLNFPVLCVFGKEEEIGYQFGVKESSLIRRREIPGSHRYNNDMQLLAKVILGTLR
ncbi:MAG TPA: AcvB/VirJ family lysyl-phosphatidylglycerol hydrolase [Daejeonella sp.]|nr:AcvB/VirJ family lysyl-phosphatidylglycerol hydrolase [Daejeonella sp.]